jgi:hypothetical protein
LHSEGINGYYIKGRGYVDLKENSFPHWCIENGTHFTEKILLKPK